MTSSFFTGRTASSGWESISTCSFTETSTLLRISAMGRPASAATWARRIFEAATICMALVIWAVFLIDLMRRRISRVFAMGRFACGDLRSGGCLVESGLELLHGGLEFLLERLVECLFRRDGR